MVYFFRHARACRGHPRLSLPEAKDVDGRVKPGHDGYPLFTFNLPFGIKGLRTMTLPGRRL
jgi:hypothetical protein